MIYVRQKHSLTHLKDSTVTFHDHVPFNCVRFRNTFGRTQAEVEVAARAREEERRWSGIIPPPFGPRYPHSSRFLGGGVEKNRQVRNSLYMPESRATWTPWDPVGGQSTRHAH